MTGILARQTVDRSITSLGMVAIVLTLGSLFFLLAPIVSRGFRAFVFQGTIEWRRMQAERFMRGNQSELAAELSASEEAKRPIYKMIALFEEKDLSTMEGARRRLMMKELRELKAYLTKLLGPAPTEQPPALARAAYGQTRWEQAQRQLRETLYKIEWDYSNPAEGGKKVEKPRKEVFARTTLEPLFDYLEKNIENILLPKRVVYWGFLLDHSIDAHVFGGIYAEILGTFHLTVGAMLFSFPLGLFGAIYLAEYATQGMVSRIIRVCINTLAGVPSIVFGLFGLAFFINTIHVTDGKSVLAGSLTLALLILPTIIRVSEEAIRSVPETYKEAALSLGASKWRAIATVILPAALPGILTGVIVSMGRAAGETAPVIFTAAVSFGKPVGLLDAWHQPTPALPWNIYNLATEHEAANEIRHVQYGMVLVLVLLVLLLNASAMWIRARVSQRLRG